MDHNSKIESLASRLVEPNDPRRGRDEDEDDDEAIFAELEAEIENDGSYSMREQGLDVFRRELGKVQDMRQNEHGRYSEVMDEKEVIRITANEPRCIVHFYHPNFKRCEIMDKHLAALAPKYFDTRFIRVFVENIPWLVEKLAVKVLPCVVCFIDGVTKDRLVGFEELGNNDAFGTAALELRLSNSGILQKQQSSALSTQVYTIRSKYRSMDNDEEFDLDE